MSDASPLPASESHRPPASADLDLAVPDDLNPGDPFKVQYVVVHTAEGAGNFSPLQGFGKPLLDTATGLVEAALLPADIRELGMARDGVVRSRVAGEGLHVLPLQLDALPEFLAHHAGLFVCVLCPPALRPAVEHVVGAAARPVLLRTFGVSHGQGAERAGGTMEFAAARTTIDQIAAALGQSGRRVGLPPIAGGAAPVPLGRPGNALAGGLTSSDPHRWWVARRLDGHRALRAHLEVVAAYVAADRPKVAAALRTFIARVPTNPRAPEAVDFPGHTHNVTRPMESALLALGYTFPRQAPLLPGMGTTTYAAAQRPAADRLLRLRQDAFGTTPGLEALRTPDVVLTAPSLYAHLYRRRHRRARGSGSRAATTGLRKAYDSLANQEGYTFDDQESGVLLDPVSRDPFLAVHQLRQQELWAYTAAISVRAASDLSPVLRLPSGVNRFRDAASNLAQSARRPSNDGGLQHSRLARRLSDVLTRATPAPLLDFIGAPTTERVVICSDAPLEWLEVDGLPLMLTRDCSRLPTTPGNLFVINAIVGGRERIVPARRFDDVLVIRAFDRSDPVRRFLEHAVQVIRDSQPGWRTRVRIVDVESLDEFAEALNAFDGGILVFDGHGAPGTLTSPGALQIGGAAVDAWTIRGTARIPPVVVLSACDTHAYDAAHASPVSAFLAAGATTVVGTSLPVDAKYAAVFVGRLLLRLDQFLPRMLERPPGIVRWSEVFPGLQRMNYVTESLDLMESSSAVTLPQGTREAIAFRANLAINDGGVGRGWYGRFVDDVAAASGLQASAVRQLLRERAWITDALKYVQFGNPDRILIKATSPVDTSEPA